MTCPVDYGHLEYIFQHITTAACVATVPADLSERLIGCFRLLIGCSYDSLHLPL